VGLNLALDSKKRATASIRTMRPGSAAAAAGTERPSVSLTESPASD
jgi:hypothetical protein